MEFKVGDKVRFIDSKSGNARFFKKGLENLEIRSITSGRSYTVWESDKSDTWTVQTSELELMPSSLPRVSLSRIENIPRHPVFEIAEQTPVFLVDDKVYSLSEEKPNDGDNFYKQKKTVFFKRVALTELGDFNSLEAIALDRAQPILEKIGQDFIQETQKTFTSLLDSDLDVPQLIFKYVFPYLRDENSKDKVSELLGESVTNKPIDVSESSKKIKSDLTDKLYKIADKIEVKIQKQIDKIEEEGKIPLEPVKKRSKKQSKLDDLFGYSEEVKIKKEYTPNSLLGKVLDGGNIAIVEGLIYDLVLTSEKNQVDKYVQINGQGFELVKKRIEEPKPREFEKGTKVKIRKDSRFYGQSGEIGVIQGNFNPNLPVDNEPSARVEFNDGYHNCYRKIDLEFAEDIKVMADLTAKGLEEKFLSELEKQVKINSLKQHFTREKILDLIKTNDVELINIAGKTEYRENGFGFIKNCSSYYAYIDVPSFVIKSHFDGNYYLFDKSRVGIRVKKEGDKLGYGAELIMIDNINHPLTSENVEFKGMCLGNNNLVTSGENNGDIIAKRLRQGKYIAIYSYCDSREGTGSWHSHRKLGSCDDCERNVNHYKKKIISEKRAKSLGISIADGSEVREGNRRW